MGVDFMKKILRFPVPFLKAYPPIWLGIFFVLVVADLGSKKVITDSDKSANGVLPLLPLNDLARTKDIQGAQK